jgi:anti-sigma factor RsiW
MNCRRLRKLLSPYLDGRLSSRRMQEVEGHLLSCAVCRQALEDLRFTSQLLSSLPPGKLLFDLAPGVVAQARSNRGLGSWPSRCYLLSPRQHFLLRQLGRAGVAAILLLIASGSLTGARGLSSWSARLGGATEVAIAYVKVGMAETEGQLAHHWWGGPSAQSSGSAKTTLDDLRGRKSPAWEGPRPALEVRP